ncbi:Uncharacterized protein FKW44_022542, partial [Caligus rogercresseyi]
MASSYEEIEGYKWNEELLRSAVVMVLVDNGGEISNSTIASALGVNLRTDIDFIIKRACKEEGAARKVRDTDFVDKVMKMVKDDSTRSMRAMSRDLSCHEKTIRGCVSKDLRCRSYKMQKAKDKRLMKSTKLLNKFKDPKEPGMLWFFADENNFCQDQEVNKQNNRWIAPCTSHVRKVMKTKFPATVM